MHQQMRESMLHQTLHVRVPSDTQKIHTSDGPQGHFASYASRGNCPFSKNICILNILHCPQVQENRTVTQTIV